MDHSVGVKLFVKLNSKVNVGDRVCEVHANSVSAAVIAEKRLQEIFIIKGKKVNKPKLIQAVIK